MPDALSKTIPIWTCVINRALFPDGHHELFTPPSIISRSEHAQIEALIPGFVDAFLALRPDVNNLRQKLQDKPMRCLWVTPESQVPDATDADDDEEKTKTGGGKRDVFGGHAHPVILVTASRHVVEGETGAFASGSKVSGVGSTSYVYIQGAADDTENWARGLTAAMWWRFRSKLLGAAGDDEAELERVVGDIVSAAADDGAAQEQSLSASLLCMRGDCWRENMMVEGKGGGRDQAVSVGSGLWIGKLPLGNDGGDSGWGGTCRVLVVSDATSPEVWKVSPSKMVVGLGAKPKIAGKLLRRALPFIHEFVAAWMSLSLSSSSSSSPSPSSPLKLGGDDAKKGVTGGGGGRRRQRASEALPNKHHLSIPAQSLEISGRGHIVVSCPTGTDLSVGVALALRCCLVDDDGMLRPPASAASNTRSPGTFTKSLIRVQMGKIVMAMPSANPSRATLRSVNSFLMD